MYVSCYPPWSVQDLIDSYGGGVMSLKFVCKNDLIKVLVTCGIRAIRPLLLCFNCSMLVQFGVNLKLHFKRFKPIELNSRNVMKLSHD